MQVWTGVLQLLYEFRAHECPIYHMANGKQQEFFTSASDCTISHWVEEAGGGQYKRKEIMREMLEPAWRLRFDESSQRLYSGDSTGQVTKAYIYAHRGKIILAIPDKVRIWERGELIGCLGTVEEIWDMQIDKGVLYTTRNLDVYLTTLRMKGWLLKYRRIIKKQIINADDSDKIIWGIQNTLKGTGPLLIINQRICLLSRRGFNILVHSLLDQGNPLLASLEGHEAIVTSLVGDLNNNIIYSGGYDRKIIAWDLNSFKKVAYSIDIKGYINAMTVDTETGVVYAGGENRFICGLKLVKKSL
jgi:WD40 repeat protein